MPVNEDMKLLSKRVGSFKKWPLPKSCSANAVKMAEAGFYHPARAAADMAACFSCGKGMEGWEPSDIPIDEHRRKGDVCSFLRYFSLTERLATFGEWPHASPTAQQVAETGFILKSSKESVDNVQCFMCGAGLEGWEAGDDPLYAQLLVPLEGTGGLIIMQFLTAEHFKRSKACPYALKSRAMDTDIDDLAPMLIPSHAKAKLKVRKPAAKFDETEALSDITQPAAMQAESDTAGAAEPRARATARKATTNQSRIPELQQTIPAPTRAVRATSRKATSTQARVPVVEEAVFEYPRVVRATSRKAVPTQSRIPDVEEVIPATARTVRATSRKAAATQSRIPDVEKAVVEPSRAVRATSRKAAATQSRIPDAGEAVVEPSRAVRATSRKAAATQSRILDVEEVATEAPRAVRATARKANSRQARVSMDGDIAGLTLGSDLQEGMPQRSEPAPRVRATARKTASQHARVPDELQTEPVVEQKTLPLARSRATARKATTKQSRIVEEAERARVVDNPCEPDVKPSKPTGRGRATARKANSKQSRVIEEGDHSVYGQASEPEAPRVRATTRKATSAISRVVEEATTTAFVESMIADTVAELPGSQNSSQSQSQGSDISHGVRMTGRKTAQTAKTKIAAAIQEEEASIDRTTSKRPRQVATVRAQKKSAAVVPQEDSVETLDVAASEDRDVKSPTRGAKRAYDEGQNEAAELGTKRAKNDKLGKSSDLALSRNASDKENDGAKLSKPSNASITSVAVQQEDGTSQYIDLSITVESFFCQQRDEMAQRLRDAATRELERLRSMATAKLAAAAK